MDLNFDYENIVLDLHDIALLLNYERATTEPRFRHAKLREVATGGEDFKTIQCNTPAWNGCVVPRTGLVFDRPKEGSLSRADKDEPDVPSNMLPKVVPRSLQSLTKKDLELYYWQARNQDGCYTTIAIFQHLMQLFPLDLTRVRVRVVENNKPRTYTTLADDRLIVEMTLYEPKYTNVSAVIQGDHPILYTTGESADMRHAVLSFPPPTLDLEKECILDLSSLQFGDVGRGFKGRGLFVLEPVKDYLTRLDTIAARNNFRNAERPQRVRPNSNDDFFAGVAERVKARWEKRKTDPWCGHCGAPSRSNAQLKRCAKCHVAHYCNEEHQLAAWPYHKHFCVDPKTANK